MSNDSASDWFQFVTINLEWINPWMKLDVPRYVDDMLDTMQEINSNALVYCYDSGGYPVYDSDLAPKDEHVGEYDLMRLIRDGTRRRGQRLYIGFLGLPNVYVARTHPQWRMRDKDGNPREWYTVLVCPNSPYGDWLARMVGEAVRKYEPDGIYLEGIVVEPGFCYCSYCQEKFRREYGREIPTGTYEELVADREYNEYRYNSVTNVCRRIRAVIDRLAPDTVFVGTAYYPANVDIRDLAQYVDAISMERQWGYAGMNTALGLPLRELGLHIQMLRAEGRRPAYSSMFIDKQVDMDYSPRSADHVRLNFMGILQCGGTPQLHIQNEYQIDRTTVPVVTELYMAELKMRSYLLGSEIIGEAALLDWADPKDVATRPDPALIGGARPGTYLDDSLRGYYRALLEHHIPTRVITVEDIEDGQLAKFPVLVLANAECLSDSVQDRIRTYVEQGGGLVMTYRTGFRDEQGNARERPGLTALAGVKGLYGEIINPSKEIFVPIRTNLPQTYYRVLCDEPEWAELKDQLLSFKGAYVEMQAEENALQIAHVVDFDYARMHPHHTVIGWYPWEPIRPLIVGRQVGQGWAIYVAAELDGASRRLGDPAALAVLAGAVRWVGQGQTILETNVPPSVEVAVHRGPGGHRVCIIMTNQSTNQHYPDPIRYIVPIRDVEVRLNCGTSQVSAVETVTGQTVEWHQEGGWVSMGFDQLQAYEGLLIDLA